MENTRTQDYFRDDNEGHVDTRDRTTAVKTPIPIWDAIWESTWRAKTPGGAL